VVITRLTTIAAILQVRAYVTLFLQVYEYVTLSIVIIGIQMRSVVNNTYTIFFLDPARYNLN